MDDKELQGLKDELARVSISMADISGCLTNFDTTLNNHMTDYKRVQTKLEEEQTKIRDTVNAMALTVAKIQGSEGLAITLIKYVIVPLIVILAGLIGLKLLIPEGVI